MSWPDDFYVSIAKGEPQLTEGQLVSGNYFQVFETYPVLVVCSLQQTTRSLAAAPWLSSVMATGSANSGPIPLRSAANSW